jgi:serine/threonine-protein kinase
VTAVRDEPNATRTAGPRSETEAGLAAPGPGRAVAGYEILDLLGRGAMGVVYKARQPGLNRVVALKMILAGEHAGAQDVARFRVEAVAVARLQHPNIVQVYEAGEADGRPYFSMEYVEGQSLARRIAGTPQSPPEAARLVQVLAVAVQAAHDGGIVHRDLKPANVLVAPDGAPKITDFGLAKALEDDAGQTQSGAVLGTPSYMSPEQAEGRLAAVGPRSDVYSLGAVLYELLTGRAPFKAGSVLDTLQQVRTMEPLAPVRLAPSVPRDLETVCLKCLQKDPGKRYQTAGALAEDLRRFLAGEPIMARPVSAPERLWRWCRRNPRVAVLSGLVALAVLAWGTTTSVLAVGLRRENDRAEAARSEAVRNAELAERNAGAARLNAEAAARNEAAARENARRAEANAATAQRSHQAVVNRMLALGDQFQRRISARRMGSGPEMRAVRADLLRLLREAVVGLARDLEGAGITSFGLAAAHQQLGDLLARVGLGEEALAQYRQAYDLVNRVVAVQPDSDKARANLAVMLFRLGELALTLQGDAAGARKAHQEAYDLLKEIADHPRGGDYSAVDHQRLQSHAAVRLGRTHLALGDLATAARCFEEALAFRRFWRE